MYMYTNRVCAYVYVYCTCMSMSMCICVYVYVCTCMCTCTCMCMCMCIVCVLYVQHYSDWVCTAVMRNDVMKRSSRLIRNLSNEKNSGFSGIRTRDLCDTGAVLYQLSSEAITVGSRSIFSGSITPLRVVQHYSDWLS